MQPIIIKPEALKKKLEKGEVKFTHTKVDGSLREARATTNMEMIPEDLHPKNPGTASVAYFDLDKKVWRSIAEGQKITMAAEDLMAPYEKPNLTEEEITLMLFVHNNLDDKWTAHFIELVGIANPKQAADLAMGFKNLVRVCRKYNEEHDYAEELRQKWYQLIND